MKTYENMWNGTVYSPHCLMSCQRKQGNQTQDRSLSVALAEAMPPTAAFLMFNTPRKWKERKFWLESNLPVSWHDIKGCLVVPLRVKKFKLREKSGERACKSS